MFFIIVNEKTKRATAKCELIGGFIEDGRCLVRDIYIKNITKCGEFPFNGEYVHRHFTEDESMKKMGIHSKKGAETTRWYMCSFPVENILRLSEHAFKPLRNKAINRVNSRSDYRKLTDEGKDEKAEYMKKYYEEHKDELAEYMKKYHQEHKDEKRKYYEEHKDEKAEYYQGHKDEKRKYYDKYYEKHKDERLEYWKKHYEERKDERQQRARDRYYLKKYGMIEAEYKAKKKNNK